MTVQDLRFVNRSSSTEIALRNELTQLLEKCPIPADEIQSNLGLFINRQSMARFLWIHELYRNIINVPGVIMEFGVRWGQNLALFQSLRGIYEPYNYTRKVIGFDTFSGFAGTTGVDGTADIIAEGSYSVTEGYEKYLEQILQYHELESPVSHIKKHALVKGDAGKTAEQYIADNPETIIALAYFNMDIYQPTAKALQAIKPCLCKGSIIGFDELNCPHFPGETTALKEVLGLDKYRLVRHPHNPYPAYLVIE
jgi:hypothetical protein